MISWAIQLCSFFSSRTGNAYGENWLGIIDTIIPRGAAKRPLHQKSSPVDVVKLAERYYEAMGFPPMPDSFWKKSVFESPPNTTNKDCHASAYDFGDGQDFRFDFDSLVLQTIG